MTIKELFAPSDMTVGKPWEKIVIFTIPMLIGNIAQQLYNTVDAVVVGNYLGKEALEALRGVRILALESNHDERMLASGPYPAYLKARVGGACGHLSNAQAAQALAQLVEEDTETVVAMHLSHENNRPSTCVRTLAEAVGAVAANDAFTEARTPDGHLTVCAAAQDWPMTVW